MIGDKYLDTSKFAKWTRLAIEIGVKTPSVDSEMMKFIGQVYSRIRLNSATEREVSNISFVSE